MTVILLTKPECSYCEKAKDLLRQEDMEFRSFCLIEHPILREFVVAQGIRSVPVVYIHAHRVGGYDDLRNYIETRRGRY